jgi:hypothetical protein
VDWRSDRSLNGLVIGGEHTRLYRLDCFVLHLEKEHARAFVSIKVNVLPNAKRVV